MNIVRGSPICGPARAESPTSPQPRATPWVPCPPFPTPCKGKSKSQPFAHTFALTGRRRLYTDTQGVALGSELAALSGRSPQPSPPSLCEQSELQCYRPKKRYNAAPQSASLPTSHTYFPTPSNKSSFCGRDSCYPRPRVALPSAASSATCGRESMTSQ